MIENASRDLKTIRVIKRRPKDKTRLPRRFKKAGRGSPKSNSSCDSSDYPLLITPQNTLNLTKRICFLNPVDFFRVLEFDFFGGISKK